MYHAIVKQKLRRIFAKLGEGDFEPVLQSMAATFEHSFAGNHALGGSRSTSAMYRKWFERLRRIFPELRFSIRNIVVSGPPWNTLAVVEWVDHIRTQDGGRHRNSGVHIIRMRWTRVVELRIYTDSQKVAELCEIQGRNGIPEALLGPLEGA